ncbi:unnamed protein product [Rotaria sp. Silwood1]|nr:unnamed protein product [Rotaria sp. Silwood1]CAF1565811.1 unnamed protein product [Rotaria sp. Silwood1]
MPRTVVGDNVRISTIQIKSHMPQENRKSIHTPRCSDSKCLKSSSGLICLWCSRFCHQQCWKNMNDDDDDDRNKCDYGKFKNIIVRPQWLRRVSRFPSQFQARFFDDIDESNSLITPLIVFINKLSGGQKGESIYRQLIRLLNPRQIFLLENDTTVKQALSIYSSLRNTRIYICGGDGTVGWILSILADTYSSLNNPPVSICPLGTGNDLSRVLGWGWYYNEKRLLTRLQQIPNAQPIALDRWQITFEPLIITNLTEESRNICRCLSCFFDHPKFVGETDRPSYQNYRTPLNVRFTNYLSFGLDAAVVLDFHDSRNRNPSKFTSPFKNKLIYLNISRRYFREFALWRAWDLTPYMRLICDGKNLTDSIRHCHTIVLLNIPSYGSGTHPWSRTLPNTTATLTSSTTQNESDRFDQIKSSTFESVDSFDYISKDSRFTTPYTFNTIESTATSTTAEQIGRQDISDRKIEVVGLDSMQMALIHIGFRGHRIAQCSEVRIELIRSMPVHMDGEPFYLPESIAINVTHAGQVLVLRKENS